MRKYTPRRATKRWLDGDCPEGVLAIFDNPDMADRYTVFYTGVIDCNGDPWIGYRGMSENPSHPQGVGMYGELTANQVASFRRINYHKSCRWSALPEAVKKCVLLDLAP